MNNFDWKNYLKNNLKLQDIGITTPKKAWVHYNRYSKKYDEKTKTTTNNYILCMCCHFSRYGLEIVKNNLDFLLVPEISTVIICYSTNLEDLDLEILGQQIGPNRNAIFLKDTLNNFMDFGKYKMIYNYIRFNKLNFDKLLLLNDSIILCDSFKNVVNDILSNQTHEFIGMLETLQCKRHCQSWWLNFNTKSFYYWGRNIKLNHRCDIVQDLEVKLGNNILNKFSSFIYFPLKEHFEHNLFFDNDILYETYIKDCNFKILKIKRLLNIPLRPKLSNYIIDLIPPQLKHYFP